MRSSTLPIEREYRVRLGAVLLGMKLIPLPDSQMSLSRPEIDVEAIAVQDLETIHASFYPASSLTAASEALLDNGDGPYEEFARRKVEGRIAELENEARALKTCLNATTITGRLPPEILSRVFLALISSAPTTGHISQRISWIRVTHVCRRWRAVALTFPALWSNITIAHDAWTQLMLCRSKEAPLSVELDIRGARCDNTTFKALLSKIFRNGNRLCSVKLCVTDPDMLSDFPASIPRLQQLILTGNFVYGRKTQLPVHILAGDAPKLTRLEVVGFSLSWKVLPSAPKLALLKLTQHPPCGKLCPSALADSIGRMPQLQSLDITNLLPSGLAGPLPQPIHLPAIQSFSITDDFQAAANFLKSCTPFQAQTINIVMSGTNTTAEAVDAFFASVATLRKVDIVDESKAQPGMQALHLKCMDYANPNLTLEAHYRPYDPKVNPPPDLRISVPISRAMVPQVVSSFAERFDVSTIHWLTIALGDASCLGGLWKDVFSPLERLETLQFIGGATVFGFVSAMAEKWAKSIFKTTSRSSRSSSRSFFPALSTIRCRGVDFDIDGEGLGTENAADLARLLKRWPRAHPLREIHLNVCRNFTSDDYVRIKDKSPGLTVKWDGIEDIDEEEDDYDFESDDDSDYYFQHGFYF